MEILTPIPERPVLSRFDLLRDTDLLGQYLVSSEVLAFIGEVNSRYMYWSELGDRDMPLGLRKHVLWLLIKLFRKSQYSLFQLTDKPAYQFRFTLAPSLVEQLHELDIHLSRFPGNPGILPEGDHDLYLTDGLARDAIGLAKLGRLNPGGRKSMDILLDGLSPGSEDEAAVASGWKLLEGLQRSRFSPYTSEFIRGLHARLFFGKQFAGKYREEKYSGEIRSSTGELLHSGSDSGEIENLLQAVCRFANESGRIRFVHPLIKGIILFYLICYIRPFEKGNTRIGALFCYVFLQEAGYPMVPFVSFMESLGQDVERLYRAFLFSGFDENDITYFIQFVLGNMHSGLLKLITRITDSEKQMKKWAAIGEKCNLNRRQAHLLRWMERHPDQVFSVSRVQSLFRIVYETARTDLSGLAGSGWLEKHRSGRRKMLFGRSAGFGELQSAIISSEAAGNGLSGK
jgi:Fic family protein